MLLSSFIVHYKDNASATTPRRKKRTVTAQYVYSTDELVTELQPGQRNVKTMTRPTALAAMLKTNTKSESFWAHFEDLEASWVNVSAIINSIGFDYVFLTKKLIGSCYKVENYRFVLLFSTHSIYKGNLEGKSV